MKPHNLKLMLVAALLYQICLFIDKTANAGSLFLVGSTADTKYRALITCLEANNNDSSTCLNQYIEYFRAEIEAVKAAKEETKEDSSEYKVRLDKMVEYLKKTTDYFYNKAVEQNNLDYYGKASKCAELLVKLSDKFKDYEKVLEAYERAQNKSTDTGLLDAQLTKIQNLEYPSDNYLKSFNALVENVNKASGNLDKNLLLKIANLGNDLVARFMNHLRSINTALESYDMPNLSLLDNRYTIYKRAAKIPNVDSKNENFINLRKKMVKQVETVYSEFGTFQKKILGSYINGNIEELGKNINLLKKVSSIILKTLEAAKASEELFAGIPRVTDNEINILKSKTDFLDLVNQGMENLRKRDFGLSVKNFDAALAIKSVDDNLLQKARLDRFKTIETAVSEILKEAKAQENNNRYIESAGLLNKLYSLPLNGNQKRQADAYKDGLVARMLKQAKALRKEEKFLESLIMLQNISLLPLSSEQRKQLESSGDELLNSIVNAAVKEEYRQKLFGR